MRGSVGIGGSARPPLAVRPVPVGPAARATVPSRDARRVDPRLVVLGIAGALTGLFEIVLLFPLWLTFVAMFEAVVGAAVLATAP
jgi:hypothetical protein